MFEDHFSVHFTDFNRTYNPVLSDEKGRWHKPYEVFFMHAAIDVGVEGKREFQIVKKSLGESQRFIGHRDNVQMITDGCINVFYERHFGPARFTPRSPKVYEKGFVTKIGVRYFRSGSVHDGKIR